MEKTLLTMLERISTVATMEKEKMMMSGVPEVCSVTSTVDAQRDASTKSLVSRKVSVDKDLYKLMIK